MIETDRRRFTDTEIRIQTERDRDRETDRRRFTDTERWTDEEMESHCV